MSDKKTIAAQLLRAVNQQEIALAEERAAHLATRQELSMALAQRHVLVEAAVRATIEACALLQEAEMKVGNIDPAPIVARVLGGGA